MKDIDKNIGIVIDEIKRDIISTRKSVFENANMELINLYFRIGKYIYENSQYGTNFISNLSIALKLVYCIIDI